MKPWFVWSLLVEQAGLKLNSAPASAAQVLGLKACAAMSCQNNFKHFFLYLFCVEGGQQYVCCCVTAQLRGRLVRVSSPSPYGSPRLNSDHQDWWQCHYSLAQCGGLVLQCYLFTSTLDSFCV